MIRGPLIFLFCDIFIKENINLIGIFVGLTTVLSIFNLGFESLLYKDLKYNFKLFKSYSIVRLLLLSFVLIVISPKQIIIEFIVLNFVFPFLLDGLYSLIYVENNISNRIRINTYVSILRNIIYVGSLVLSLINEYLNYLVLLDLIIILFLFNQTNSYGENKIKLQDIYQLLVLTVLGFASNFLLRYDLTWNYNNTNFVRLIIYLGYASTILQEATQYFLVFNKKSNYTIVKYISISLFIGSLLVIKISPFTKE